MKHLSIAVILFLTVLGNAHANTRIGADPTFTGQDNFAHRFPQASNVTYKVKAEFTEVNFMWNDMKLQAFYDRDGNFLATCRPVTFGNLPLSAQMSLRNTYPDYIERDAIEYNDADDGVTYYVTVVGTKFSYLLRVSTGGTISVFKKMKN